MSTNNEIIHQCNYEMIEKLPGDIVLFLSKDSCTDPDHVALYETEFLNKISASGMPPHRLALKVGDCIIIISNLRIRDGHCNGTRYIVLEIKPHVIQAVKLEGGPNAEILIPRIPMLSKETDFVAPFQRIQFPVLVAYYLTLNRAQGQPLDPSGMYLPQSVFSWEFLCRYF